MKFLITADLHSKRGLYYGVVSFLIISLLFWVSSFFNFYFKYGFSYDDIFRYYFTDPEFPESISLQQLAEDFHINTFILSFFYLLISSIFAITEFNYRLKTVLILSSAIFGLLYCLSDFFVFVSPQMVVYSKLLSFLLFQTTTGVMLLISLIFLLKRRTSGKRINLQKMVIYLFALFSLLFVVSMGLVYYSKFGFGISGIKDYFLGNPEEFRRPKTVAGILKSLYPHIFTMAVFSFTLSHFASFSGDKRRMMILGILLMLSLGIDNFSSIFILFSGDIFSYVKMFSFYISIGGAITLIYYIFRGSKAG